MHVCNQASAVVSRSCEEDVNSTRGINLGRPLANPPETLCHLWELVEGEHIMTVRLGVVVGTCDEAAVVGFGVTANIRYHCLKGAVCGGIVGRQGSKAAQDLGRIGTGLTWSRHGAGRQSSASVDIEVHIYMSLTILIVR